MNHKLKKQPGDSLLNNAPEELYQALFEQAGDAIFIADKQGRYIAVNQRGCDLLGYTREEILHLSMQDLVPTEDQAHHPLRWADLRADKIILSERRLRRKDGRLLPVEISARMLSDGSLLGIIRDISERQQTEETLRRLNRELRAISNCNQVLMRAEDEQTLVNDICRIICDEASYHMAWVGYAEDDEARTVRPVAWAGAEEGYLALANITWADMEYGRGPTGTAIRTGKSSCIQDFTDCPQAAPWRDAALRRGYRSSIALPLKDENGQTFGVLNIYSAESNTFTPDEKRLLEELAADLAFGINILRTRAERAQAEQKMSHLASIVASSDDAIISKTLTGIITSWNRGAEKIYGFTESEVIGKPVSILIPPGHENEVPSILGRIKSGKNVERYETMRCRKDGRLIYVSLVVSPIHDSEGKIIAASTIARDITEHKRLENALHASSHYSRSLIEASLDPLVTINPEGKITDVNQATESVTGVMRERLIGSDFSDYFTEPEKARAGYQQVLAEGLVRDYPLTIRHASKHTTDVLYNASVYRNEAGEIQGVFAAARDITERKQREEALREAHQILETIFDHTHMMVACLDPQLNFIRVNRAYAQADDREPDFFPGKNHFDLYPNAENEAIFRRVVATGEPYFAFAKPFEYQKHLERGVSYWDWSLVPIKYADGCVAGLIFTLLNVTDRLWAEQALRESEARFRSVYAQAPIGIELYDAAGQLIDANPACLDIFGVTDLKSVMGFDLFSDPHLPEKARARLRSGESAQLEVVFNFDLIKKMNLYETTKSGERCLDCRLTPMMGQNGAINGYLVHVGDVTEQKRAEEERLAHLRFFENMDQVNRAIQGTSNPEQMMRDVLDVVLAVFGCDRAWLLYPCDPEAASWHVPVERTRPAYPGAMAMGVEVPMTPEAAVLMRTVLSADSPVRFDPDSEYPLAVEDAGRFGYQSQISLALHPRTGKPWMFGLHQCSYARVWTPQDERLFQEVGRRLADALTSLLAYRELRSSEARFRTLVDHATDAFLLLDDEGIVLDVNRQTCESLGYGRTELLGMTSADFDLDATPAFLEQARTQLNAGEVVAFDARYQRKDGTVFPVEVRIRPFWQDGRRFSVALARNITERKRAETEREQLLSQIQQQAQEVQFIVDTVPEGIFLFSEDGRVRLTNSVAEEYLALLSPGWQDGALTHLGQRPLAELLTSPPKGLWHEVAGNGRHFEVIARPIENRPHHQGWVFVLHDVTRERQIRRQVQRQERLAAIGQLAAGIAHDFNNTLAVIKLYTDLILRSVELPAGAQERLRVVEQQTRRAADLIQQILDFSRQSVMEKQPLDLLPFLKELINLLERTLPEDIQIKLDAAQDEYLIRADPSRIQQVILNLAFNARDAMPHGGDLTINLKALQFAPGTVLPVSGMSPGKWVQVAITDNGIGMSQETLAHIFEPFFTTKEREKGTGLGLAQVYGIVQRHRGFIDVATEVNQGTTFYLYFPAFYVRQLETIHLPDGALPVGQGELVLIVEDDATIRQALTESLHLLNYKVLEASNGREALTLLAQRGDEIALVLSDAVMPEMGGIALFHTMQKRGLTIPFIIITGHAMEVENLRALGLSGWLAKPPDMFKLAEMLQNTLKNL